MNINSFQLQEYTVSLYSSTTELPQSWDALAEEYDILLSKAYLQAIEAASPVGMKLYFATFKKEENLVAIAVFQHYNIKGKDAFRPQKESKSFLDQLSYYGKKIVSYPLNFKVLTAGNLTLTGEHAYCINHHAIEEKDFYPLWVEAIEKIKKESKAQVVLIKDFYTHATHPFSVLKKNHISFEVEPNMALKIREEWIDFQSYVDSMEKKYRARVQTARKKSESITKKILTEEEVKFHQESIYKLYKSVSDNATFNTFVLPENYFYEMKKSLQDKFSVVAYFQEDKIVGFFSIFKNRKELDTHFLGYCPILNRDYQLYFNMLLDMVSIGIYEKFRRIVFGRTAVEIKSTIGAEPFDMLCFIQLRNPILHQMTQPVIRYFKSDNQFVYRSPFKA